MDFNETFNSILKEIKKDENYVPRNYQTVGGMWTVDTWKKNDLRVQVMDEGYTNAIALMKEDEIIWAVTNSMGKVILRDITEDEFISFFNPKKNTKPKLS